MLWVDMLLRSYVLIEPYYVLADGTAYFIIYFNNYVIVTDVIVTRPGASEAHFIYYCHYGSWCYYRTMWVSGGHHGSGVMGCYLSLSSGVLTKHLISYMGSLGCTRRYFEIHFIAMFPADVPAALTHTF